MKINNLHERLVYYSEAEELANRFTHGLGVLLSIGGVVALIVLAAGQDDAYRVVSACIYGASMIIFYCLSTAYHSVRKPL